MQKSSDILIFDRNRVAQARARALPEFEQYNFLFEWSKNNLIDRISDINRTFTNALQIGARGAVKQHDKITSLTTLDLLEKTSVNSPYICASEEFLPIASQSIDLLFSNLCLHSVNDLPGALLQIRRALKADGLFIASMLGGETLHEMRKVMAEAELEIYGGISPRISPFADKPQMGDLLQRAGFALPVVDSDIITVTYDNVFKLMKDLRGMGENNAIIARKKTPTSKAFFMSVAKKYHDKFAESDGRIVASFEVIFLLGWSPHESQQKPLKPGSAEHKLADILGTQEIKTGEKAKP